MTMRRRGMPSPTTGGCGAPARLDIRRGADVAWTAGRGARCIRAFFVVYERHEMTGAISEPAEQRTCSACGSATGAGERACAHCGVSLDAAQARTASGRLVLAFDDEPAAVA